VGRISEEDIRRVRDASDLVAIVSERVVLKQKGRLYWGRCPFHGEKTPSFKIDPATQLWHCFGCGLGGDVYGYVMRTENLEFADAVRMLAERAHIEIVEEGGGVPRGHKERLIAANEAATAYYQDVLTRSSDAGARRAREYLASRGFGSDVAKRWRLGYAPGRSALARHLTQQGFSANEIVDANLGLANDSGEVRDRFYERVMFPIVDLQGRPIAFGGRVLGQGEPKYLNTQDTPVFHKSANLYAIDRAKASIVSTGDAIVVEGYTDVIALHEAGIANATATLGTALTREHVKLLSRFAKRIVYLFDGDAAGMRAADRASEFVDLSSTVEAGRSRVDLYAAVIPGGSDPADLVAAAGAEAVSEVIASAAPLLQFSIDRRLERWDLERPEERERALSDAVQLLVPIRESETAREYARYIAGRLFADPAIVIARMASARPAQARTAEGDTPSSVPAAVGKLSLSREVRTERQLLGLLVRFPRLRARAHYLLAEDLLTDEADRGMAQVIADAEEGLDAAELVQRIQERYPGGAEALSGFVVDETADDDADEVTRDLVRRLKERDLERRIAEGSARLRERASFADEADYDGLFKEVSDMQRQLEALKSGATDI
jgi:DNA primase